MSCFGTCRDGFIVVLLLRFLQHTLELVDGQVCLQYARRMNLVIYSRGVGSGTLEKDFTGSLVSAAAFFHPIAAKSGQLTVRSAGMFVNEIGQIPYFLMNSQPAVVFGVVAMEFRRGDLNRLW